MAHKIRYPSYVQPNVNAAESMGHEVVSQGCGMFRCTRCAVRGYLDEGADTRLTETKCAPKAAP